MKFVRPRCYFDVELSDIPLGRIVFELYSDICPITCENFRALCTGEKGIGKTTGKNLHYQNIVFHRVVRGFMIQSGDFSIGNGTGGESIYGGTFEDENFALKHDEPFLLSMANRGKDTNGSQFFITTQPAPHLDGIHVVFGHVVSGQSVVTHIENLPVDKMSRPLQDVRVMRCNELMLKSKLKAAKEKRKVSSEESESEEEEEEKEKSGSSDDADGEDKEDEDDDDKECVEEEEEVEQVEEEDEDKGKKGKTKKLMNQFNFCERGSLTYNNPYREVTTQTIPPPRDTYNDYVTQWIIYDAYCIDYENQQRERDKEKQAKVTVLKNPLIDTKKKQPKGFLEPSVSKMLHAAKVLERMCNQNTFDDIAQDFRYYEDISDEFRDGEGTLLPLWKFSYENTKKYQVTFLKWHPHYYDLFGISFGSFDFLKKCSEGYISLFSLKNPSFPEYINNVKSGVMCFDFHHTHSSFMAIGLYDGSVRVFNTALSIKQPQYRSDSILNKHQGVVWEVVWGKDMSDGEMNFFSVSADGKIFNWILLQNQLQKNLVLNLYLSIDPVPAPDGNLIQLKACGTCIAFHPDRSDIFLVGTEEGKIYQCSTVYPSVYLCEYQAHHMPVHGLSFNYYNSSIFLSCSADMRVKVWD
uniref:peptidylprolyl isomerase n=1 Tax=Cacopsylla melanoneura TaxID=428564 RepID=A0A8D8ZV91_9HEMI